MAAGAEREFGTCLACRCARFSFERKIRSSKTTNVLQVYTNVQIVTCEASDEKHKLGLTVRLRDHLKF